MPPRRSGRITGGDYAARIRSNAKSRSATNSPTPSSNDSLTDAPTSVSMATVSSGSTEISAGMLTSPNKELTSPTGDSSVATTSTDKLHEQNLAPVTSGKVSVSKEKTVASSGNTAVEVKDSRAEDLIVGEAVRIENSDTKTVNEGGKKKIVKKKVKVMKVVKRMVARKVMKGSLQTEIGEKKEEVPNFMVHKHTETSESMTSTSMEVENGDPIPISSDSIRTDNMDLSTVSPLKETIVDSMRAEKLIMPTSDVDTIPITSGSLKIGNANLREIVSLEVEGDIMKEPIGIEKVDPSCDDTMEGESTLSSGVSTSGIILDLTPDDMRYILKDEKIETHVNNQVVDSFEIDKTEKVEDQSVVPVEDDACAGKGCLESGGDGRRDAVKVETIETQVNDEDMGSIEKETCERLEDQSEVPEEDKGCAEEFIGSGGAGLNGQVAMSAEMEALERKKKRKTEIFIGGLDKNAKEEDIRKVYERVGGKVEKVRLMTDPNTKKCKGFAFVRFASAADAKDALTKYSDVEICGKKCGVRLVEGNDTLFLANIDKKWKSDDVLELVKKAGVDKVDYVLVKGDPRNPELNRGFAFLEMKTSKDAKFALNKLQSDFHFQQKKIAVTWAEPLIEPDEGDLLKVKSIYAEFLPSSWDEKKAKGFFQRFGELVNISLAKDIPSSKRKDVAFVNYKSREDALACIEAFNHNQLDDDGSKVTMKVSLTKPTKSKKMKVASVSTGKKLLEPKPMILNPTLTVYESRNQMRPTNSSHNSLGVDKNMSTNDELIQLLRKQATVPYDYNHGYPLVGSKRPLSAVEHYTPPLNPRGHHRMYPGTYHPTGETSGSAYGHPSRILPLPIPQQQNIRYTDAFPESGRIIQNNQHNQLPRRAPYYDYSDPYRRY